MPPKRIKRTALSTRKTMSNLPLVQKKSVMKSLGASPDVIKMAIELDKKIAILKRKDPGLSAAFGFGCGGVTC